MDNGVGALERGEQKNHEDNENRQQCHSLRVSLKIASS